MTLLNWYVSILVQTIHTVGISIKQSMPTVVQACLEFTIGDQVYTGKVGDFYIFPFHTLHALRNKRDKEGMMLIGAIKETTNKLHRTISQI
ncbi:MAG TPA: hypothetical protein VFW11_10570 [Cyclobacteriaceae bacterium]|nr:hypothetical protein [Cyclobacteriaceae bacterium]